MCRVLFHEQILYYDNWDEAWVEVAHEAAVVVWSKNEVSVIEIWQSCKNVQSKWDVDLRVVT